MNCVCAERSGVLSEIVCGVGTHTHKPISKVLFKKVVFGFVRVCVCVFVLAIMASAFLTTVCDFNVILARTAWKIE